MCAGVLYHAIYSQHVIFRYKARESIMSYVSRLIKIAVKWTPKAPFLWLINLKLKGIADITHVDVDLDAKLVTASVHLYGEPEAIEVRVENFAMLQDEYGYQFVVEEAYSNKPWLNNALAKITAKPWQIPNLPAAATPYLNLAFELLKKAD